MRSINRFLAGVCLLSLVAAAPALATTLPRGSVSADCSKYTVTFDAEGFDEPGDSITVTFRIVVVEGSQTRTETHTETITGNGSFQATFEYAWNPPLCGDWMFLEGGADGSRYEWVNNFGGSSADVLPITTPPSRTLSCACEPPVSEICRTPGFWGTHAGFEKNNSKDITLAVLGAAPDGEIMVCGKFLNSTALADLASAEEALCVSPRGDKKLQLARQLTAAALNCVISGAGDGCAGTSIEATFAACDALCAGTGSGDVTDCIEAIDCFNNGGKVLANGQCQVGTCSDDGDPCSSDDDCRPSRGGRGCADPSSAVCVPTPGNCHDRPLVNASLGLFFDPPGPAGSSGKCNDASRNNCTIFACSGGSDSGHGRSHDGGKHGGKGGHGKH